MPAGFTKNYTGRRVDLSFTTGLPPDGRTPVDLTFPDAAEIMAGPQKAAMQWAVHFLTRRGTVVGDSLYGTEFMTRLLTGQLRDDLAIEQAFAVAVQEIRAYQQQTGTNAALDEVVTNAQLLDGWDYDKQAGKLDLRVGLTLASGRLQEVLIPIPVAIQ